MAFARNPTFATPWDCTARIRSSARGRPFASCPGVSAAFHARDRGSESAQIESGFLATGTGGVGSSTWHSCGPSLSTGVPAPLASGRPSACTRLAAARGSPAVPARSTPATTSSTIHDAPARCGPCPHYACPPPAERPRQHAAELCPRAVPAATPAGHPDVHPLGSRVHGPAALPAIARRLARRARPSKRRWPPSSPSRARHLPPARHDRNRRRPR